MVGAPRYSYLICVFRLTRPAMFRRRKKPSEEPMPASPPITSSETEEPVARRVPTPPTGLAARAEPSRTDLNRRFPDLGAVQPASVARRMAQGAQRSDAIEGKRLTVGRDISMAGEIASCDVLTVEGTVDATLSQTRAIEVSETGLFRGVAEVELADIAGRYSGTLTVRDRLIIRGTGRVTGTIRYARLEIELGGEIAGDIQSLTVTTPSEPPPQLGTFGEPSDEPHVVA